MKSNEEFTASVFAKAERIEANKRKFRTNITKTGIGVFALALIVSGAFAFSDSKNHDVQSSAPIVSEAVENIEKVNKEFALVADCSFEASKEIKSNEKVFNVSIPIGGFIDVKDTSNMSTDEINRISYNLKMKLQKLYGTEAEWHISGNADYSSSVYFATAGKLKLILPKNSDAERVVLSCTDNGNIMISDETKLAKVGYVETIKNGTNINVTADEYKKFYGDSDGMFINWKPSDQLITALSENPDTDISSVTDTITGSVNYSDGTSENFVITINFDEEGMLKAFYSYKNM